MSEERMPFLSDPHPLAYLDDPHHFICHLADCLGTALAHCDQIAEARVMDTFRQRKLAMGIDDCGCYGLSAADEVAVTLSINNTKALDWARTLIALGLTEPADPKDPATVLDKLFWPVSVWCGDRGPGGKGPQVDWTKSASWAID